MQIQYKNHSAEKKLAPNVLIGRFAHGGQVNLGQVRLVFKKLKFLGELSASELSCNLQMYAPPHPTVRKQLSPLIFDLSVTELSISMFKIKNYCFRLHYYYEALDFENINCQPTYNNFFFIFLSYCTMMHGNRKSS